MAVQVPSHRRAATRLSVPVPQAGPAGASEEHLAEEEAAARNKYKQRRRVRTNRVCRLVEEEMSSSDTLPLRYRLDKAALSFCKQKYLKLVLTSYE